MLAAVVPFSAPAGSQGADARCPWVGSKDPPAQRATAVVARMTLDDKIAMVHGTGPFVGAYAGTIDANPRLCIPAVHFADGAAGVANGMTGVTQLPAPIALAATWDPALARRYGAVVGAEVRGKGAEVNLGPTVNIVRDPRWGRAFESYGEDPLLAGRLATGYVRGVQAQGVMAQVKHFAAYNQETDRNEPQDDAIVSRRALEEVYLPQFEAAVVDGHAASVMCSYATINDVHACENALLADPLRSRWGFDGFVTSDWYAAQSTSATANAGLDVEMPGGAHLGGPLREAVERGEVPLTRLDEMVHRVLTQMFRFGVFDRPEKGSPTDVVTTPAHAAVGRQVADEGIVLLRNRRHVLPLEDDAVGSIAVVGADADADTVTAGDGSATVHAEHVVTPLAGIEARAERAGIDVAYAPGTAGRSAPLEAVPASAFPSGLTVEYFANADLAGPPVAAAHTPSLETAWAAQAPAAGLSPEGWSARYRGVVVPPATGSYSFALDASGTYPVALRLSVDGRPVIDSGRTKSRSPEATVALTAGRPVTIEVEYAERGTAFGAGLRLEWRTPDPQLLNDAVHAARAADVAIVVASNLGGEDADLLDIDLAADSNELIAAVADANPRTVVVLDTNSAVTMPWIESVAGVVEGWYPGQDGGTSLARVLFGDVDPGGRLPVTFPQDLTQVPASTPAQWTGANGSVSYSEDVLVGYRWYGAQELDPQFAFGFGLSYTTFAFDDLTVRVRGAGDDSRAKVAVRVRNTGDRAGSTVVQVYVTGPEPAPQALQAFRRVRLQPGEERVVTLALDTRAFAHWDDAAQAWTVTPGRHHVEVGDSSDHLPVAETVDVPS